MFGELVLKAGLILKDGSTHNEIGKLFLQSRARVNSFHKQFELTNSVPILFWNWSWNWNLKKFGTKCIELELELKDFELN